MTRCTHLAVQPSQHAVVLDEERARVEPRGECLGEHERRLSELLELQVLLGRERLEHVDRHRLAHPGPGPQELRQLARAARGVRRVAWVPHGVPPVPLRVPFPKRAAPYRVIVCAAPLAALPCCVL